MNRKQDIRVRIAPSPTGPLHIGTARTALFNYLFAKKSGGKFILRLEDTDQKRSKKEFEEDIMRGLKWLGLNWDEGPYYQSKDLKKYQKYAKGLLKKGLAYEKDEAIWFNLKLYVTSYKLQVISYSDLIHGKIEFSADKFNDFVIIKKDDSPTFMFGNVVDDHEMKISHVIRGEDHITNTPQQILIYRALAWNPPQYGHVPLILNKDRSKMSKRKDPVSISHDFRDQGYLPEAMINYMALLGWNPKTEREFFTLKELGGEFDLKNVNKSGAIFDGDKLNWFNLHYLKQNFSKNKKMVFNMYKNQIDEHIDEIQNPVLVKIFELGGKDDFVEKIMGITIERITNAKDVWPSVYYFFQLPEYDPRLLIFKKSNKELTLRGLELIAHNLSLITSAKWQRTEELNKILLETTEHEGLSNGDVFWPVRVALSGVEKSPSPAELLWVLGKEESLKRMGLAINKLKGQRGKK